MSRAALLLSLLVALPACDKVQALTNLAKPAGSAAAPEHGEPEAKKDKEKGKETGEAKGEGPDEYAVPFAWETSTAEPLGRTRSYLRDVFNTNGDYMALAGKTLPAFADKQTPRATVLSCADSRVQTTAFDASPENDDFMVRNIGNQVENAHGSIEYGIEHLDTPLLLILGHTGCGAVKAAMDGIDKLDKPIRDELAHIHAPKRDQKKNDREAWVDAVVDNVHQQVDAALADFGKRVHSGRLTIVGGFVDIRNDVGLGSGRLVVVNVNGNRDQKRIGAFVEAVTGHALPEPRYDDGEKREEKRGDAKGARSQSTAELLKTLAALPPADKPARGRAAAAAEETHEVRPHSEHARAD